MTHVVVENQIALGDEIPVARNLHQLMAQGLDRHDAIHAIASVKAIRTSAITQLYADSPLENGCAPTDQWRHPNTSPTQWERSARSAG